MNYKIRTPPSAPRAGFTILELLVVMVVVGIISTISAGRIHDLLIQQRMTRAANVIQTNAEAAFAIAVRNRRPIEISWTSSTMQMQVTDRTGATAYRKVSLGRDPYGLTAGNVTFSRSPLEVYPNGLANDTLLITFSNSGVTKKVYVSRAGMVQLK